METLTPLLPAPKNMRIVLDKKLEQYSKFRVLFHYPAKLIIVPTESESAVRQPLRSPLGWQLTIGFEFMMLNKSHLTPEGDFQPLQVPYTMTKKGMLIDFSGLPDRIWLDDFPELF